LPLHIVSAHVDVTLEPEQCADRGGGDAVLTRTGFGDDAPFAHPLGEERLPERIVDLVGSGVGEVLALEKDARSTETG
jgi:hypothetical protein